MGWVSGLEDAGVGRCMVRLRRWTGEIIEGWMSERMYVRADEWTGVGVDTLRWTDEGMQRLYRWVDGRIDKHRSE